MDVPDVHYARSGGVAVAYQVIGDGPQTLVFSPQVSDLLTIWLISQSRAFLERLSSETRLVIFNPRGTGLSDRPRNVTLEMRMDDIASVLDAMGVHRASLVGISTSANACALFAATYPERVERLILIYPFPRAMRSEDYPWGGTEESWLDWVHQTRTSWGERDFVEQFARDVDPALVEDPDDLALFVWQQRLALSPTAAADWIRLGMETDIVDILGAIRVPTLVLHRPEVDSGRGAGPAHFVAERIRGSRVAALHSAQSSPFSNESASAILEFLHGDAPVAIPDSVLATVLFTDIVGSTERAAELGDRAWGEILGQHHADVRSALARYRGIEVDSAGDGFFCRFEGPARAIACAHEIVKDASERGFQVRAGIHTGECERVGEKIAGISVITGSRILSLAAPGEVLVSSTVKDLVAGSGFAFGDRGEHELKGVPGRWRLFAGVST